MVREVRLELSWPARAMSPPTAQRIVAARKTELACLPPAWVMLGWPARSKRRLTEPAPRARAGGLKRRSAQANWTM